METILLLTKNADDGVTPWLFDCRTQAAKARAALEAAGIAPQVFESELWNDAEEVRHAIEQWRVDGSLAAHQRGSADAALEAYRGLAVGVADMLATSRLRERDIPDDYQWLVGALRDLAGKDAELPEQINERRGGGAGADQGGAG
jgi:hypothetical protein